MVAIIPTLSQIKYCFLCFFHSIQPEPDETVLLEIKNLESLARFHTEKLDEILSALSNAPSAKHAAKRDIPKVDNTEVLQGISDVKNLIKRLPKEEKQVQIVFSFTTFISFVQQKPIDVNKELAPAFSKLESSISAVHFFFF